MSALILFICVLFLVILFFVAVKVYSKRSLKASLFHFRNPLSHRPRPRPRPRRTSIRNEFSYAVDDDDYDDDDVSPMADFREHAPVHKRSQDVSDSELSRLTVDDNEEDDADDHRASRA